MASAEGLIIQSHLHAAHVPSPSTPPSCHAVQVVLDTVELVLVPGDLAPSSSPSPSPGPSNAAAEAGEGGSDEAPAPPSAPASSSSWFGDAFRSLAVRMGLNLGVSLSNVLIKYLGATGRGGEDGGEYAATLAFQSLQLASVAAAEWKHMFQVSACMVVHVFVSMSAWV